MAHLNNIFYALIGSAFGSLFTIIGLYLAFGRFIWKDYRKKRTFYAVTDKKVLVLNTSINSNLQDKQINKIDVINKRIRSDGIGSIVFGEPELSLFGRGWNIKMYRNSGLEFFYLTQGKDAPAFYDIKNAQKVYDLVEGLRKQ